MALPVPGHERVNYVRSANEFQFLGNMKKLVLVRTLAQLIPGVSLVLLSLLLSCSEKSNQFQLDTNSPQFVLKGVTILVWLQLGLIE